MNTKNIKAVIFDMDGTLIDTEKYYRMFWPKALAHFGYEMTDEQALTMRSLGQPYAPQHLKEMFRDPDLDYTAIRNYRKQIMGECLKKNGIEIKKGAIELLDYLKAQGIRRAIATATDQVRTEQYLKQLGLYGYFDQIICATMVEHGKPSPDIYQYACRQLALLPEECIAVEDSPNGVCSAYGAGCNVVMVPDQTEPDEALRGKLAARVDSLDEIIKLFKKFPGLTKEDEEHQLSKIIEIAQDNLDHAKEDIRKINEDLADLLEVYDAKDKEGLALWNNATARLKEDERELVRYEKARKKPYFGRIDFRDPKAKADEAYYIGRVGITDSSSDPVVLDWRAPIASVYYESRMGTCQYTVSSEGTFEIDLKRKRTYEIENDRLKDFFDSDVVANDELLTKYLAKNKKAVLGEIIATIQKEQNAIIRNTQDRILAIQGVAGSGKTSVALHRIAYLLYHDRENLKSSNVLVLSPNGVFSDYISHILPELGEENIREMSFDMFAYRELRDTVSDCEDRCDQIEKELLDEKYAESCRKKQSIDFVLQLNEFVLGLEDRLMRFSDLKYKGMTKSERQLTEMFYYRFPDIPLLERMQAVMDYVVDEYETLIGRDLGDDEIEIVRGKFMKMYRSTDLYVLYNWFLKEYGYETLPQVSYEKRFLKYEDVYPMLYLKYLLKSRRMDRNIRHLVIDEMQDYSYMQYLILDKMFSCKMTILGDKAQTMEEKTRDVLSFLPRVFGRGIRKINMNKSYRNTMEIASYANSISDVSDMELFERHGKPVEEQTFLDRKAALEDVLEKLRLEEFETAAVIEMTQERAKKSAAYLKERMEELGMDTENRFSVVDRDSTHFKKGLTVTTFYLAKGLEFDQVFALYTTQDNTPLHRQARYICATRALHELYMYEVVK